MQDALLLMSPHNKADLKDKIGKTTLYPGHCAPNLNGKYGFWPPRDCNVTTEKAMYPTVDLAIN